MNLSDRLAPIAGADPGVIHLRQNPATFPRQVARGQRASSQLVVRHDPVTLIEATEVDKHRASHDRALMLRVLVGSFQENGIQCAVIDPTARSSLNVDHLHQVPPPRVAMGTPICMSTSHCILGDEIITSVEKQHVAPPSGSYRLVHCVVDASVGLGHHPHPGSI